MCHPVITEYVKARAYSRRDLFPGSTAACAAIVASSVVGARPLMAQTPNRMVDLTYTLTPDFPTYFGEEQFFEEDVFT